jgi:predicted DNA-binding transcriptional regulator YafY
LLLSLRLTHLDSIPGWVLGWGGLAEVLEPASLREEVARQARAIARAHRSP